VSRAWTPRLGVSLALALAVHLVPIQASAQTSADDSTAAWMRLDLQATTRRLWHGLTRVSGLAATSQVQVGANAPGGSIAVGALETWDLCRCLGKVRLLGGGDRGPGELDLWGEYRLGRGDVSLSAGAVRYIFHGRTGRGGLGSEWNSTELYLTAEVQEVYLSPRLSAWVDLGPVQGTYLELGGALPLLGWPYPPFHEIYLEGDIGFSVSQGPNPGKPAQLARYAGNGFTHARLKLGADLLRRRYTSLPVGIELQANFDDAVRSARSGPGRDLSFGVSAGLLAYVPLARSTR
jgi:hypothetical protein